MVEFLGNTDIKFLGCFREFFRGHMFGILAAYNTKDTVYAVTRWQGTILYSRAKERQYFWLLITVLRKSVSFIQGECIDHKNPQK